VHEIILAPLAREDLGRLIGDALHCEPERVTALAELIHEKTAGNPFFANQLISVLVEEGLLTFDYGEGRWSWDLNSIRAKGYTDNVADFMAAKLSRLPPVTQKVLGQLACLGNAAESQRSACYDPPAPPNAGIARRLELHRAVQPGQGHHRTGIQIAQFASAWSIAVG
jgi:hypothetical protein